MRHKGLIRSAGLALVLSVGLVFSTPAVAQSEQEAVMAVITTLFDGMRAGDGEMVRGVFAEGASMSSVVERDGVTSLNPGSPSGFADAVGQPHDEVWDERIWDAVVYVDGHLASVWTPYAFYRGTAFSHCGANSFQLMKGADGWKIVYLVDSRRTEGCEIPEAVQQGH
ncbi:MAG: hypothetical protein SH809_01825 [Rhodothermales bacterium]|nr:hypothetical protein [Rhodothermales bacterium]